VDVLILTVFVSVVLVIGELIFFAWNVHHDNHDHIDRLSLMPLNSDAPAKTRTDAAQARRTD
jgi:hypothetical protein